MNDERVASLERSPRRVGDDGDAGHQQRWVVEALDLDDVTNTGNLAGLGRIDFQRTSVEDRTLRDRGELRLEP